MSRETFLHTHSKVLNALRACSLKLSLQILSFRFLLKVCKTINFVNVVVVYKPSKLCICLRFSNTHILVLATLIVNRANILYQISLSKKLYSNCLVLVGSRKRFERDLHKQIIDCFTIELK